MKSARRSRRHALPAAVLRGGRPSVRGIAATSLIVAVGAVAVLLFGGSPSGPVGALGPSASLASSGPAGASFSPGASAGVVLPSASPSGGSPSPTLSGVPLADVPIVPVTNFRSTATAARLADVKGVLAGTSTRWHALELVAGEADPILTALTLGLPTDPTRLMLAKDSAALARDLASHRDRLAFLRADRVGPSVRALNWGDRGLFGVDRTKKLSAWALMARLPETVGNAPAFDPATIWTIVAGGDILLDRGVAKAVTIQGKGVDYPFNGGTATITSRVCCSSFDWPVPTTQRTDHAGAVRHLLRSADVAVANFENPAPDNYRYHTEGTIFSANPDLIAGLRNAGIDVVSIANNHIRDAGAQGVLDTIKNLESYGIRHAGAGANLAAARRPAVITTHGVKVAILAYDAIASSYAAGVSRVGDAPLSAAAVKADIARARAAGADVVIVYPHWGTEYTPRPFAGQQALARKIIDAGADMVIGNHAHWVGAMEIYKGRPIWYALGNFVFDQTWSEPTMEGITLELTFRSNQLVQARIRPHIILGGAQPNFMDPAGSGRVVLGQLYGASKKTLPW